MYFLKRGKKNEGKMSEIKLFWYKMWNINETRIDYCSIYKSDYPW